MRYLGRHLDLAILDVDGVIIDSPRYYGDYLCAAAKECNLPSQPFQEHFDTVYAGKKRSHARLRDLLNDVWSDVSDSDRDRFKCALRKLEIKRPYPPVRGSYGVILHLLTCGVPVALCTTNNPEKLQRMMEKISLPLSLFAFCATSDAPFVKPHPKALDHVIDSVPGVSKERTIFVGDMVSDYECARECGVEFFAVLSGRIPRTQFSAAGLQGSRILDDLNDLIRLRILVQDR